MKQPSSAKAMSGVVEWFRLGRHDHVEEALPLMRSIGVEKLRTHLSWADFHADGGKEWYDWLLPKLAAECEVLPCIHYTPPSMSETGRANGPPKNLRALADFADAVIDRYGSHFPAVELWNEPNNILDWDWRVDPDWTKFSTMIGAAGHWVRQRGRIAVLGGLCPNDRNLLDLLGQRGVYDVIDVVALHGFPGTWDSEEGTWNGWPALVDETRETLAPYCGDIPLWITETGYSTWRKDAAAQARRFLDAIDAPVERMYWYGLQDLPHHVASQEGHHFDERHYHLGLFDEHGQPKLTARLLAHGGPACVSQTLALARATPAIVGRKPIVITGGAGFIGSNLAESLAADGRDVLIFDGLMRDGVEQNLEWLRKSHPARVTAFIGDIREEAALTDALKDAAGVFHFAAQVAVTSSLVSPREDFTINAVGTFNLLEALRQRPVPLVFASTNKVYGDLGDVALELASEGYRPVDRHLRGSGIAEDRQIDLHTPYGCSKGAADQYVLDYARSFGLEAAVLRMSCIYGQRQFGTEDQGWVAHFAIRALRGETITIYGDGHQVRDILHVDDAVRAYRRVFDNISRGKGTAFNLGGGPENAVSLNTLIAHLEDLTGRRIDLRFETWRPGDQKYYVSNRSRLDGAMTLDQPLSWKKGVGKLVQWLADYNAEGAAKRPSRRALSAMLKTPEVN